MRGSLARLGDGIGTDGPGGGCRANCLSSPCEKQLKAQAPSVQRTWRDETADSPNEGRWRVATESGGRGSVTGGERTAPPDEGPLRQKGEGGERRVAARSEGNEIRGERSTKSGGLVDQERVGNGMVEGANVSTGSPRLGPRRSSRVPLNWIPHVQEDCCARRSVLGELSLPAGQQELSLQGCFCPEDCTGVERKGCQNKAP